MIKRAPGRKKKKSLHAKVLRGTWNVQTTERRPAIRKPTRSKVACSEAGDAGRSCGSGIHPISSLCSLYKRSLNPMDSAS